MDAPGLPPLPAGSVPLTEPHPGDCFGCGSGGIAGLDMPVYQVGDEVVGDITFGRPHVAGHGAVHGGAVTAVCDDILSYLLFAHSVLAVTRSIEVGFRRPVHPGTPYRLTARIAGEDGRKVFMSCEGVAADGTLAFTAEAVFLRVDAAYFDRPGARLHPRLLGKEAGERTAG